MCRVEGREGVGAGREVDRRFLRQHPRVRSSGDGCASSGGVERSQVLEAWWVWMLGAGLSRGPSIQGLAVELANLLTACHLFAYAQRALLHARQPSQPQSTPSCQEAAIDAGVAASAHLQFAACFKRAGASGGFGRARSTRFTLSLNSTLGFLLHLRLLHATLTRRANA